MAVKNLQIRLDEDLKKRVEKVLKAIGLDAPTAVRIFFIKVAQSGGIPFMIQDAEDTFEDNYSPAMLRKLDRIVAKAKKGIEVSKTFDSADDFLADLHSSR